MRAVNRWVACMLLVGARVVTGADGWMGDLAAATERAAAEKKPLLVVFRCVP